MQACVGPSNERGFFGRRAAGYINSCPSSKLSALGVAVVSMTSMGIEDQLKKVKIPGLSALALSACFTFFKLVLNLQNSRPIVLILLIPRRQKDPNVNRRKR